jgi:hypothetical protein
MWRPNRPELGIVLGLVEAWPSSLADRGKVRAIASLEPSPRRPSQECQVGTGESRKSNKGNDMNREHPTM